MMEQARRAEQEGRLAEALRSYQRVLSVQPSDGPALLGTGRICLELGEPSRALESFTVALVQQPSDAEALRGRALALANLGYLERGLDDLDRAIELEPDNPEGWLSRGSLLAEVGAHDAALRDLRHADMLLGNDDDASLQIARCLLAGGHGVGEAEAEARLSRLGAAFDDDPYVQVLQAELLARRGEQAQAASLLRSALAEEAELVELADSLPSLARLRESDVS